MHETGSLTLRGARGQKRPKNSSHTKCMTLLEFYLKWFFLHQWYYAAHRDQHCKKQFSLITNVVAQSFLEPICWFEHSSSPADSGYCPPLKRRKAQKIYIRKIGKKTQNFLHWANFDLVLGLHEAWIFLKAVMGRKLLLIWEIPHSIIQFQRVTGVFYKTENNSCNQGPLLVFCCTVGN